MSDKSSVPANDSGLVHQLSFSSGNPAVERVPYDVFPSDTNLPPARGSHIGVLDVPNQITYTEFCQTCNSFIQDIEEMQVVRKNDGDDCYSVLIKFYSQDKSDAFYEQFNDKKIPSLEGKSWLVRFTSPARPSVLKGQPRCPLCGGDINQDSGGILTTICNLSFHCSCIAGWIDPSDPVCQNCQQQHHLGSGSHSSCSNNPSTSEVEVDDCYFLESTLRHADFKQIQDLGRGRFGTVKKYKNIVDRKYYAIKKICFEKGLPQSNDLVLREVFILSSLHHHYIIRYFQAWIEKIEDKAFLYIQMEYCPRSLSTLLKDENQIDQILAWRFFDQILEGVIYIHKKGIVHRDLKPDNILLDAENNVRIGDFGLAKYVNGDYVFPSSPKKYGTFDYMAPEFEEGGFGVDSYSLGIIFFELWLPFSECDRDEAFDMLRVGTVPEDWRKKFPGHASFVEKLLKSDRPDPNDIPQLMKEIFKNEGWFKKLEEANEVQQEDTDMQHMVIHNAEVGLGIQDYIDRAELAELKAEELDPKYNELLLESQEPV